jgi:hypothetical protein
VPGTSNGEHETRTFRSVQSADHPTGGKSCWTCRTRNLVESRVFECWDLESGKLPQLAGSEGLLQARWSADGHYIAALNPAKKQVWLYDC